MSDQGEGQNHRPTLTVSQQFQPIVVDRVLEMLKTCIDLALSVDTLLTSDGDRADHLHPIPSTGPENGKDQAGVMEIQHPNATLENAQMITILNMGLQHIRPDGGVDLGVHFVTMIIESHKDSVILSLAHHSNLVVVPVLTVNDRH